MWIGQAGGFGGGRGLHSHTDGSQVSELSHGNLLSSQGDASKRSSGQVRSDSSQLSPRVYLKLDVGSRHGVAAKSIRGKLA